VVVSIQKDSAYNALNFRLLLCNIFIDVSELIDVFNDVSGAIMASEVMMMIRRDNMGLSLVQPANEILC